MKISPLLLRLIRFWPPFLGTGISIKEFNKDFSFILVQMKLNFWNKNYVGSHFGGSLYSMTDPFYMLMLLKLLGNKYIVWDKSASIRYKKPAKTTVYAKFEISEERITQIKELVDKELKAEPSFNILIKDKEGEIIAEVHKVLSVKKKLDNAPEFF